MPRNVTRENLIAELWECCTSDEEMADLEALLVRSGARIRCPKCSDVHAPEDTECDNCGEALHAT